jgi:hypothetical protein
MMFTENERDFLEKICLDNNLQGNDKDMARHLETRGAIRIIHSIEYKPKVYLTTYGQEWLKRDRILANKWRLFLHRTFAPLFGGSSFL